MRWIFALLMTFLLLPSADCVAQTKDNTITIGERQEIRSNILGETRNLLLYAPVNRMQSLPLIIVFDGESLFTPVVSATRFMQYASEIPQMPEAIVVGITNTDRTRDMPIPQQFGEKGEDNFRRFLLAELIPFLKNKYPLNGHIITIGHSQGGLFVSYLLGKSPELFPWAIALDAPMTVDAKTNSLAQDLSKVLNRSANKARYVSVESLYGWDNDWKKLGVQAVNTIQLKLPDESHESMPFKGIYDGLKFLYHDFSPPRKDLSLPELRGYYQSLSTTYGYTYEIPLRVLLASAGRKLLESRKDQIMAMMDYAEEKYGSTERSIKIRADAGKLAAGPDTLIDHYLGLGKPSPEQVKKYIGRWTGTLVIRAGQNMPMDIEILMENGKTKLTSVQPWPPYKKEEPEIFSVSNDGKLIFGRRNRGSGLVISTAQLDKDGKLTGEEWLIGFTVQDDFPDDVKKQMKFIIENPNVFTLSRK